MKFTLIFCLAFFLLSTETRAQTTPEWVGNIQKQLDRTADWQTSYTRFYQFEKTNEFQGVQILVVFKNGIHATFEINLHENKRVAAADFGRLRKDRRLNAIDRAKNSLGDESISLRSEPDGTTIYFRTGRAVVSAMSESEEVAEALASLAAKSVPSNP